MALAHSGALGRPLVATCETLWFRPDEYFDVPWRGRWDVEGGGPTMGHGIHQFDLLLAVLGPWSTVSAFAARQLRPTDTEDVSIALARFDNGALATVVNSLVSPRETSRLRFDFEYATRRGRAPVRVHRRRLDLHPGPGHEDLVDALDGGSQRRRPADTAISSRRSSSVRDAARAAAGRSAGGPAHPGVRRRDLRVRVPRHDVAAGRARPGDDPFVTSMSGGIVPWAPVKEVFA